MHGEKREFAAITQTWPSRSLENVIQSPPSTVKNDFLHGTHTSHFMTHSLFRLARSLLDLALEAQCIPLRATSFRPNQNEGSATPRVLRTLARVMLSDAMSDVFGDPAVVCSVRTLREIHEPKATTHRIIMARKLCHRWHQLIVIVTVCVSVSPLTKVGGEVSADSNGMTPPPVVLHAPNTASLFTVSVDDAVNVNASA